MVERWKYTDNKHNLYVLFVVLIDVVLDITAYRMHSARPLWDQLFKIT